MIHFDESAQSDEESEPSLPRQVSGSSITTNFDEDEFFPKPSLGSSYENIVKRVFCSVATEAETELKILQRVYSSFAKPFHMTHMSYETLEERYGRRSGNFMEFKIGKKYTDMVKIQKELGVLLYLLNVLINEAKIYGTFTLVTELIRTILRMKRDEKDLMRKVSNQVELMTRMRKELASQKQVCENFANMYSEAIKKSIGDYRKCNEHVKAKIVYVDTWQKARYQQNLLRIQKKADGTTNRIDRMNGKIEQELRCHEELERYIMECQQDYFDEIQNWMDDYDSTLERKDNEIYNKKNEIVQVVETRQTLNENYEKRQKEMEDWLEYKMKKEAEERLIPLRIEAATKIQRWWRSLLMRLKLGPYKPKKDKKGKKGNKSS